MNALSRLGTVVHGHQKTSSPPTPVPNPVHTRETMIRLPDDLFKLSTASKITRRQRKPMIPSINRNSCTGKSIRNQCQCKLTQTSHEKTRTITTIEYLPLDEANHVDVIRRHLDVDFRPTVRRSIQLYGHEIDLQANSYHWMRLICQSGRCPRSCTVHAT